MKKKGGTSSRFPATRSANLLNSVKILLNGDWLQKALLAFSKPLNVHRHKQPICRL